MSAVSDLLRKLRAVVLSRGVLVDDAEDIVQEAFVRLAAYAQAHAVRSEEAFLMTTAVNIANDQARRRRISPFSSSAVEVEDYASEAVQPEEWIRARERLRRVSTGIARLDPDVRRLLLAHRLEGLTYAEIAAREKVPVARVEKQVARAVMFLIKWSDGW
jgi:RNA polymerase sigma factor (sigma-70 family)